MKLSKREKVKLHERANFCFSMRYKQTPVSYDLLEVDCWFPSHLENLDFTQIEHFCLEWEGQLVHGYGEERTKRKMGELLKFSQVQDDLCDDSSC